MSYKTLEVELENGRVHPIGTETLPAKATALLTILTQALPPAASPPEGSLADRVKHLAGIGRGEYTDLSTNKAHLDGFCGGAGNSDGDPGVSLSLNLRLNFCHGSAMETEAKSPQSATIPPEGATGHRTRRNETV